MLLLGLSKNPLVSNLLIRWAFIGFSLVEVSGFIGLVFSFLFLYAFKKLCYFIKKINFCNI
jgi:F0F1-type ATP synthase membrane subunit c/vacuolar-type H+-ATPase subunit K